MGREVGKDKSVARVDAAAGKASAKGSGSAGGSLKAVSFRPGKAELFNKGK